MAQAPPKPRSFLLLNQTFHPDVMATGQYLAEVACELAVRGHKVTVLTSRRAYDHPEKIFPREELWRGVRIFRIGSTGFGKGAKWRRALDFGTFMLACCWRLAWLPRHDAILALTSPPLISFIGALTARARSSRFYYWVMDFNPDEAIAAGWLQPGSLAARFLEACSRYSLRRAQRVFALDRFMQARIEAKGIAPERIRVLPPWSLDQNVQFDPEGRQRFRQAHGLEGKFVVMYSGNHSPCHPLDTLLAAAERLAAEEQVVFCFVGGGSQFKKVQEWAAEHRALCLPYQPLSELAGSLSAADLHVVVMGDPFVGLVHPCKLYNIAAVGAPVLYIGPEPSHVTDLAAAAGGTIPCYRAAHGDTDAVVRAIARARSESAGVARTVSPILEERFSRAAVLSRIIDELEGGASGGSRDSVAADLEATPAA